MSPVAPINVCTSGPYPRCTIEESHPEVAKAVEAAYDTSQKLSEKWGAAHDASDAVAAAEVRQTIRG